MADDLQSEYQQRALSLYNSPQMQSCLTAIDRVAAFRLTEKQRGSFLRYHRYITSTPRPEYLIALRAAGGFYRQHVNGVLGHVQNALACVYYHLRNVSQMESSIAAAIEASGVRNVLDQFLGSAGGNTLALDFEYQAFVLSVRRCLDYLTRALACYFKNEFHSFRRFGQFLANAVPRPVATASADTYSRHSKNFAFAISDSEKRSTRDRISHYEFVPAGVVNITKAGLVLAGGGEELNLSLPDKRPLLRDILKRHSDNLQHCIDDLLDTFVKAASREC
jgi:hypothetical protein